MYVVEINKVEEISKIKIDGIKNKDVDNLRTSHIYFLYWAVAIATCQQTNDVKML